MHNKKKYTVTVGIAAYNESKNIKNLLNTILAQTGDFILVNIYVLNDASIDETKAIVQKMSKEKPIIKLIDDETRQGKNKRLDYLYKIANTDIIFVFDGDVVLKGSQVLNNAIKYIKEDKVVIVGCNKIAVHSGNFIGDVINTLDQIWYESRVDIDKGINIYNFSSCAFAVRTSFVKELLPRVGLISETEYLYFNLKKKNLKARFAKEASILFRNPDNIHDYLMQRKRFDGSKISGKNYGNWTEAAFFVSNKNKMRGILKVFINKPFLVVAAVVFRFAVNFIPFHDDPLVKNGMWQTVQSSKKAINI